MTTQTRAQLEDKTLADLHEIANQQGVEGFRRLRKPELISALLGSDVGAGSPAASPAGAPARSRRTPRRTPRSRTRSETRGEAAAGGRQERSKSERSVDGTIDVLANGSGFIRAADSSASKESVYVSAAQVRRCDLVSGDRVSGPVRAARRSERHPALIRVETVNGKKVGELARSSRFDERSAVFPFERFEFDASDATLSALDSLAPFGKGSRVVIVGPTQSGKSEIVRTLARALSKDSNLDVATLLLGIRPEELADWTTSSIPTAAQLTFSSPVDSQVQAIERAVNNARRVAGRGRDAVILVDTLQYVGAEAARKLLASARKVKDGGSVTVIATALNTFGGETTVIALDATEAALGRYPALDAAATVSQRVELLVGDAGAKAITRRREDALTARDKGSGRGFLFRGRSR